MSKNLIPEIARMLGVEIGEEFEWHSKHDCITYRLKFMENEVLYCTRRTYKDLEGKEKIECHWIDGKVVSEFFKEVLGGHDEIIKLPWKPKEDTEVYTFSFTSHEYNSRFCPHKGVWYVTEWNWAGFPWQIAALDKGWVYRTKEEAEAALPKVAKEVGAEYELSTSDTEAVEPWKPGFEDEFYTFTLVYGKWKVCVGWWENEPHYYALLDKGWIYRTREEAEAALPAVAAEMGVEYEL